MPSKSAFGLLIVFVWIQSSSGAAYTYDRNASCGCSASHTTSVISRIVGGEVAQNRAWGWMISLRYYQRHRCGASLVSAEYVITAAHCVNDFLNDVAQLSILAGVNYLDAQTNTLAQRRTVTAIRIHPKYNSDANTNDIALIRFSSLNTGPNSTLSFACLPNSNQDPFNSGNNLIAIGWGVLAYGNSIVPNALQQVTVQAIASGSSDCRRVPISDPNVQFCAGLNAGGKDTCQGDSGGPLMAFSNNRWFLAGITSSGYGCALPGYPGLYTRVSSFISFIQSITNIGGPRNTTTTRLTTTKPTATTKPTTTRSRTTTTMSRITATTERRG